MSEHFEAPECPRFELHDRGAMTAAIAPNGHTVLLPCPMSHVRGWTYYYRDGARSIPERIDEITLAVGKLHFGMVLEVDLIDTIRRAQKAGYLDEKPRAPFQHGMVA